MTGMVSALTGKSIQKRRAALRLRAEKVADALTNLQSECPHTPLTKKYEGSGGNYDPSSDCYWIYWNCSDCGRRWTTDQSYESIKMFPHAVRIR